MEEEKVIIVHRRVTVAAQEASRANGAKAKAIVTSEEHKAKLKAAQHARREREKAEREALGIAEGPQEKKKAGRPRTRPETTGEKRPRGRPKKEAGNG